MATKGRKVQSVETTLKILDLLQDRDGARVTELADELDMNKGAVHTHLSTLQESEYIIQSGNIYKLGLRFLDMGEFVKDRLGFYDVVQTEVNELAKESGEIAQFATEEHGKAVYLCKAEGEQAVQTASQVGMREHLHCLSLGKAILSEYQTEFVREIVARHGLPRYTPNTITSQETLFEELEAIREREYAIDDGEKIPGLRCVAAPVVTNNGTVLGAISITGPSRRMQGKRWNETLPDLVRRSANVLQINSQYSD